MTALSAREQRNEGFEAGADEFLTKPVDTYELLARVRSLTRIKRNTDDLDSAASSIMTLAVMIEGRDGYAEGHCHRIANDAAALGRSLELGSDDRQALYRSDFLYDGMPCYSRYRGAQVWQIGSCVRAHEVSPSSAA